jgi:beta-arrestin
VHVLAAFRYGREDLDVLGLTFRKDLFIAQQQIYPKIETLPTLTSLQQRLLKKLGAQAYPFFFQLPKNAPASVTLQPAAGDTGKVTIFLFTSDYITKIDFVTFCFCFNSHAGWTTS